MACDSNCKQCLQIEENFVTITNLSYPQKAKYGEYNPISFTIHNPSFGIGNVIVCLHQADDGYCVDSRNINIGMYEDINISINVAIYKDVNFRLSLIDDGIITKYCNDFKEFTIFRLFEVNNIIFMKNGSTFFDCLASTQDNISFYSSVGGLVDGVNYKFEWKIINNDHPEWGETSFWSSILSPTNGIAEFRSVWNEPFVNGNFEIVWGALYDEAGNKLWEGLPPFTLYCKNVFVSLACNPPYISVSIP